MPLRLWGNDPVANDAVGAALLATARLDAAADPMALDQTGVWLQKPFRSTPGGRAVVS
jgi:hypothetical protein